MGDGNLSCQGVAHIIRAARDAGIILALDPSGKLRLRAAKKPSKAMIDHLRAHKPEILEFLKAKAKAEARDQAASAGICGWGPWWMTSDFSPRTTDL